MIPILIDTTSLRQEFDLTQKDVEKLIDYTTKEIGAQFATEWEKAAQTELSSSREQYIRSIVVTDPGMGMSAVELVGEVPNMIEAGAPPFDMKPGLLNGPNAKTTSTGKKINTVPFKIGTPGALSENFSTIFPESVYEVMKTYAQDIEIPGGMTTKGLESGDIPAPYDKPRTRTVPIPNSDRHGEYVHKSSIYQGIQRQRSNVTNQNSYVSFRRVSEGSDPLSWIHPGFKPANLAEKAMDNLKIDQVMGRSIDNFLIQNGFTK
jgi:hypothetical protein